MASVAVIGGGLGGLSAAYFLKKERPDVQLCLYEAGARLGGGLQTEHRDGFTVEGGADSMLVQPTAGLELAKELGLGKQIISTNNAHRGAYVLKGGQLHRIPEGFQLIGPSDIWSFLATSLVSPRGKIRAMFEPFIPRADFEEESLHSFVTRRFGKELFEKLAQPLASGIYGADPSTLSMHAALPRFVDLERRYGSVTRGLMAGKKQKMQNGGGARYGMFCAFKGGMQSLVDALYDCIAEHVQLHSPIDRILPSDSGFELHKADGACLNVDAIVLAVPAHAAAALLREISPEASAQLRKIEYGSAAVMSIAFDADAFEKKLDAFGIVIPEMEKSPLLAATFSHIKYPGRAPEGKALVRCYFGGHNAVHSVQSDQMLFEQATKQLDAMLGLRSKAHWFMLHRYDKALPRYTLGHLGRVRGIEQALEPWPKLMIAGNSLHGVGIPQVIKRARDVCPVLLKQLV